MAEELIAAKEKAGRRCIVTAQTSLPPADILEYDKRIIAKAAVTVVAAGGYYGLRSYPPYVKTESKE